MMRANLCAAAVTAPGPLGPQAQGLRALAQGQRASGAPSLARMER